MSTELDAMYKDIILEHNKDPRNFGPIDKPDVVREGFNPMCGDRILLSVRFGEGKTRIEKCGFEGEGCSICMASTSIMTDEVQGRTVEEVLGSIRDFRELMQGKKQPEEFEGDVEALAGVRRFPVRIKCALLGWTTLRDALEKGPTEEDADDGVSRTE